MVTDPLRNATDRTVADLFWEDQTAARMNVVGSIDEDPDKTQRAIQLAQASGVAPGVVLADQEAFEREQKAQMATDIVQSNYFISQYVNGDPLRARVSNDDYGQLDAVSQSMQKFGRKGSMAKIGEAFSQSFDWEAQQADYQKLYNFVDSDVWRAFVANPVFGTGIRTFNAAMRGIAGAFAATAVGAGEVARTAGMDDASADRFTRDIYAGIVANTAGAQLIRAPVAPAVKAQIAEAARIGKTIEPYIRDGRPIPTGLDPVVDAMKIEQAQVDVANLAEALTEATKSTTRERNPEMFASFIREHNNGDIAISADAIRQLYGDKRPTPDDGLFGWVPRIVEQLELAEASGGDVVIPIADWLAKVDPANAKVVEEFIRARPDGVTLAEAKAIEAWHGSPHQFDAFSMEKVGTGEGAQSYGHGLYFAENRAVAETYLDVGKPRYTNVNDIMASATVSELLMQFSGSKAKVKEFLNQALDGGYLKLDTFKQYQRALELVDEFHDPNLYKVRIKADQERMLDFDRPLSEQPPEIQTTFDRLFAESDYKDWYEARTKANITGEEAYNMIAQSMTGQPLHPIHEVLSVGDRFQLLERDQVIGEFATRAEANAAREARIEELFPRAESGDVRASKALREAGIPGIRYLDEGSRDRANQVPLTPEQIANRQRLGFPVEEPPLTRNFVIFDEALVQILERNGEPLAVAADQLRDNLQVKPWTPSVGSQPDIASLPEGLTQRQVTDKFKPNNRELRFTDAQGRDAFEILLNPVQFVDQAPAYHVQWVENRTKTVVGMERQTKLAERAYIEAAKLAASEGKKLYSGTSSDTSAKAQRVQKALLDKGYAIARPDLGEKVIEVLPERQVAEEPTTSATQLEMTDMTRMEDREAFAKAAAIGMTVDQYGRYQKLIAKRLAEDVEKFTKRAAEQARLKLSQAYKDAKIELRPEVVREVNGRPHVALDNYLREGTLEGNRGEPGRINSEFLNDADKAALGNHYYSKNGVHPDDLATLFGFPDGRSAIEALKTMVEDRRQSGLNAENYRRRLIENELDRRVDEKFAAERESILEEARDMVLSETQIEMLHEETLALATQAGLEFSIPQAGLRAAIQEKFTQSLLKDAKTDSFLRNATKAGREMEMALLKGDYVTAFQQKQRQYISIVLAREAKALEKEAGKLDKIAKRFAKEEIKSVDRASINWIQSLLSQAGYKLKVTPDQINANIDFGDYKTLVEYVDDKRMMGWEPAIVDTLQTQGAKPLDKMTVQEFIDFNDAITSMVDIGRKEKQIEIAGEKADFAEFKKQVIDNLQTLPPRDPTVQRQGGRWLYQMDASLVRMENVIRDLDLRKELGPLFEAVITPLMRSKAKSFDLMQDLSNYFKDVKGKFDKTWRNSLRDSIPNDVLIDPYSGAPFDLTRENLIQVMLNWGNRSNIEKLTQGYASVELGRKATKVEAHVLEQRLKALIDQHATAEDWAFVQAMWQPFKNWQKEMDVVARNTSGVAPKWIDPEPVMTPFGTFEGGYWPVKYDRLTSNISVVEDKPVGSSKGLFEEPYFRAATAKGYLKERTGYVDFVDINNSIEQAVGTMQQTIHDIAFRDSLMQAGKIFYDRELRAAIRKHYGVEYEQQMIPWLKRIANRYTVDEQAIRFWTNFMRRTRVNLIGNVLPLNLRVILSPDVGIPNPKAWASFMANRSANIDFAMQHSQEIRHMVYNMDRDFSEALERTINKHGYTDFQRKAAEWGFKPAMWISQQFRIATFVDQFAKAKERGLTDAQATDVADMWVRKTHGAASVVDLPAIMEAGEGMKLATMFYGWFNTMYNWTRDIPGDIRNGDLKSAGVAALGTIGVGMFFNSLLFTRSKPEDSWFKHLSKSLAETPFGMVPFVRDAYAYMAEGHLAKSPVAGTIQAGGTLVRDAYNYFIKKKTPEKPIQHTGNVIGLATGLPMAQPSRTAQFLTDVHARKQQPKTFVDWLKGIIHGEIKPKR